MKKINLSVISFLLIFILGFSLMINAQDKEKGNIDWENGVITVVGFGAPPENAPDSVSQLLAKRAAKADAYRNAAEVIKGVQVDSNTEVENYVVKSDKISTQVNGFIKNGRFIDVKYNKNNTCRVTLELPMEGQNSLNSFFENIGQEKNSGYEKADISNYDTEENKMDKKTESNEKDKINYSTYTGIIIDVRSLNVIPALHPKIFDNDGYLLYGAGVIEVGNDNYSTIVAYSRSKEKALNMERVGDNPFVIEAVSVVKGKNNKATDIVLKNKDAKAFLKINKANDIINKKAVSFIIK